MSRSGHCFWTFSDCFIIYTAGYFFLGKLLCICTIKSFSFFLHISGLVALYIQVLLAYYCAETWTISKQSIIYSISECSRNSCKVLLIFDNNHTSMTCITCVKELKRHNNQGSQLSYFSYFFGTCPTFFRHMLV